MCTLPLSSVRVLNKFPWWWRAFGLEGKVGSREGKGNRAESQVPTQVAGGRGTPCMSGGIILNRRKEGCLFHLLGKVDRVGVEAGEFVGLKFIFKHLISMRNRGKTVGVAYLQRLGKVGLCATAKVPGGDWLQALGEEREHRGTMR